MSRRKLTGSRWLAGMVLLVAAAFGAMPADVRAGDTAEAALIFAARDNNSGVLVTVTPQAPLSLFGQEYRAAETAHVYVSLSSEFISVAVLSGRIETDGRSANDGAVLVTPIESRRTEHFLYDAAALSRSLSPNNAAEARPLLETIEKKQRQQRFFGLIEPVGVNAQSPTSAPVEAFRTGYLTELAIVDIRRRAGGDRAIQNRLTADRFVQALGMGDAVTVSTLLDPKPFTDADIDPVIWRASRLGFAQKLVRDSSLVSALTGAAVVASDPSSCCTVRSGQGAYRLRIVTRDRASFIASLEPIQ